MGDLPSARPPAIVFYQCFWQHFIIKMMYFIIKTAPRRGGDYNPPYGGRNPPCHGRPWFRWRRFFSWQIETFKLARPPAAAPAGCCSLLYDRFYLPNDGNGYSCGNRNGGWWWCWQWTMRKSVLGHNQQCWPSIPPVPPNWLLAP